MQKRKLRNSDLEVSAIGLGCMGTSFGYSRVQRFCCWPHSRSVPRSTVPGEIPSPTQPFPTRPAPFDRQGITENDMIYFTPGLRKEALAVLEKYNYGPVFTPPSLQKPTILMPGSSLAGSSIGVVRLDEAPDGYRV